MIEGERLQKVLARAGYGSRRACEEIVRQGRVRVNGRVAALGERVDPGRDRIEVGGAPLSKPERLVYLLLHKPRGVVSTVRDRHAGRTVLDLVPHRETRLYPVGRLDRESEGLILLTNDGALAERLLHPRHQVPRRYHVWVKGRVGEAALRQLREGVPLEDGTTAPAQVKLVRAAEGSSRLEIVLREGRKRQVRRMAMAVGHPVTRLVRVAMGPLRLGSLQPGAVRPLTRSELDELRRAAGIPGR
ncbi:pseudouridine synthase [Limnochorda pilosa]|uniref:Pseudouridine synthase n=1 Tax=Limnochorda pilosa TaxID=1555112 RepID=A0A0K2SKT9_LIMPI|nr:pseudouridine synthase [Limnochorda pilosa]BAS27632.1 RNA pseudouridine synthase [Limnochorda pilosa]